MGETGRRDGTLYHARRLQFATGAARTETGARHWPALAMQCRHVPPLLERAHDDIADLQEMLGMVGNEQLHPIVQEAKQRLRRVVASPGGQT